MTSIDKNQPEKNVEDLHGPQAIERIKQVVADSPNCFFCCSSEGEERLSARPMNVRKVKDDGSLWFLASNDSSLSEQLAADNSVDLLFHGKRTAEFMQLSGVALMSSEPAQIDELWEPILKPGSPKARAIRAFWSSK